MIKMIYKPTGETVLFLSVLPVSASAVVMFGRDGETKIKDVPISTLTLDAKTYNEVFAI